VLQPHASNNVGFCQVLPFTGGCLVVGGVGRRAAKVVYDPRVRPEEMPAVTIRPEKSEDIADVRRVNELAFGRPAEANLVDQLREGCADAVSLVAEDGAVVGHTLFTPVVIENAGGRVVGMGLAPMAVIPDRQRHGIGSLLARRGLDILRDRGCPFVVVVGHPEYYPRFGFESASAHGLTSQWEGIPDRAFMVLVLDAHAMAGITGVASYRDEFNEVA
jgi:putative acetyltransferase